MRRRATRPPAPARPPLDSPEQRTGAGEQAVDQGRADVAPFPAAVLHRRRHQALQAGAQQPERGHRASQQQQLHRGQPGASARLGPPDGAPAAPSPPSRAAQRRAQGPAIGSGPAALWSPWRPRTPSPPPRPSRPPPLAGPPGERPEGEERRASLAHSSSGPGWPSAAGLTERPLTCAARRRPQRAHLHVLGTAPERTWRFSRPPPGFPPAAPARLSRQLRRRCSLGAAKLVPRLDLAGLALGKGPDLRAPRTRLLRACFCCWGHSRQRCRPTGLEN